MTKEQSANIQRTIGNIEGQLGVLIASVKDQGDQATQSRRELYNKVNDVAAALTNHGNRIENLESSVAKIEPIVKEFSNIKEQAKGARWAMRFLYACIVGAVGWLMHKFGISMAN